MPGGNTTEPLSARLVTGQTRSDIHNPPPYTEQAPIFLFATSPVDLSRRTPTIRGVRESDTFLELVAIEKVFRASQSVLMNRVSKQRPVTSTSPRRRNLGENPFSLPSGVGGWIKKIIKQNRKPDRVDQTSFTERTSKTAPTPLADRVANVFLYRNKTSRCDT